jgi:large-conductance mechanosensitive channel
VAASDTVKRIVEGFINPVVQFIVGSQDSLATATWTFEAFGRSATFAWGAAVSSLITLLATALVIYWLVQVFRLDKLDKKKS